MSADQSEPSSVETGDASMADPKPTAADAKPGHANPAEPPKLTHQPSSDAKPEAARQEAKRPSGHLTVLAPSDREWDGSLGSERRADEAPQPGPFSKRRIAAMAAVVALAVIGGAVGGALVTSSFGRLAADDSAATATKATQALTEQVARIDADLTALKNSVDQAAKLSATQAGKTSDRFDKAEKAQADTATRLAKLGEAVDRLKTTPVAAATPVAATPARDVTGSIAPVPTPAPKPEVARLPTVEGWVLREVADGGAIIEGRQGAFEVFAGDPIPGLGRVDAIRRQDGRWVVVTSRGLIVSR
uniref:Uncharacterized protein n=1 Tax=Rhodopseudomonas palustris (strain BisA53) TaxID=316055 RepID=Q07IJ1_RHOP5